MKMPVHISGNRNAGRAALFTAVAMAAMATAAQAAGEPSSQTAWASSPAARALARAAASSGAQILGGFTSQGWPVVVEFNKSRTRIALVLTGLEMSCASGNRFPEEDGWVHLAIPASGHFHKTITLSPQPGTSASLTGGTDTITGQFNRQRSKLLGTWELRQNFTLSNGQSDQCDSGRVGFALKV